MTITRGPAGCAPLSWEPGILTAQAPKGAPKEPTTPGMTLRSPAFPDGGENPQRYGMSDPAPVSPKLQWTNLPDGTVSFALIFHDPDGAPGGGWTTICTG